MELIADGGWAGSIHIVVDAALRYDDTLLDFMPSMSIGEHEFFAFTLHDLIDELPDDHLCFTTDDVERLASWYEYSVDRRRATDMVFVA